MDDTKKLIEKYKRELMELSKTAAKPAEPTPASQASNPAPRAKTPQVIGYVSDDSADFPAVFNRMIAEAVENNDVEISRRDSTEGYPNIDSESDSDNSDNADNSDNGSRPEDDMNQGTGETITNFPVSNYSTYEEFEAANTGGGALEFMVFTASEALPVAGAAITVTTRIDGESHEMFKAVTNQSGETEPQTLPAPSKELSQHSDNAVQPFSLYDATVTRDGFTRVLLRDIPIFDGVRSIQRVAMIPDNPDNPDKSEEITEVQNAK